MSVIMPLDVKNSSLLKGPTTKGLYLDRSDRSEVKQAAVLSLSLYGAKVVDYIIWLHVSYLFSPWNHW